MNKVADGMTLYSICMQTYTGMHYIWYDCHICEYNANSFNVAVYTYHCGQSANIYIELQYMLTQRFIVYRRAVISDFAGILSFGNQAREVSVCLR